MNPITIALQGKGPFNFLRRSARIAGRYGWTPRKMDRALARFVAVLERHQCGATLPITCVALQRHPRIISNYLSRDIEFAIHGYRHVDYSQLSLPEQRNQLIRARHAFAQAGIQPRGFRGPYLRWNPHMLTSLQQQGLVYDSSQALAWEVLGDHETPAYRLVLKLYDAKSVTAYPSLPRLEEQLVRIPYSLPDDEALLERLALKMTEQISTIWLAILERAYKLGELFVLGLHPERIATCEKSLSAVLGQARSLTPSVWIARMDEISAWWQARAQAAVTITNDGNCAVHLVVAGPKDTSILARGCQVDAPTLPWADGYQRVQATIFAVHAHRRPFIGLSPETSTGVADFLRQQGYILEISDKVHSYSYYLDQAEFTIEHERPLLAQIEGTDRPLVRLGRWPNGARCALAVTGDIDALTLWDFGLRYLGR
jgi:peptidoglycan/xylan/chitin deacetylase (PgdA/CDA1 family)